MAYQVFRPYITQDEINAVAEVLQSRWIGLGPKCTEFEKMFAEYTGSNFCVTINSCTAALDMALRLCDIHQHDKVLVPTMTFVSTAHAVCYNNATPVFVDCDDQLQMDFEDIKNKYDKYTKAIIVVHYGGRINPNIERIAEFCKEKHIWLIEDCAHAAGSFKNNKHAGTFGNIGCFSFHAVKNLAMGDGGAIITNDSNWHTRAKKLRWLGIDKGTWDRTAGNKEYWWEYQVDEIGYKNHLNDILASIGIEQLKKLNDMNKRRCYLQSIYKECLKGIPEITLPYPYCNKEEVCAWHIMWIKAKDRDNLSMFLKEAGINTGVHYKPIHTYKCYGNIPSLPHAENLFKEIISLPMYYELTEEDVEYICSVIKEFYSN